MNYLLLKTELSKPEFIGLTPVQCVEILGAETGFTHVYVENQTAVNYLLKNGVWDKLEQAADNTAYPETLRARIRTFFVTLQNISLLNFENFEADIPTLVGVGIISQSDADGFMNLARVPLRRWGETVEVRDIQIARLFDKADGVRAKIALLGGYLSDLEAGIDVDIQGVV